MKRLYNQSILSSTGFASTTTSSIVNMDQAKGYCCIANISNDTPAGKNFLSGESEINTLTFEAVASMDDGEYVVITDTNGDLWAVAADLTGSSAEPTGAIWATVPVAQRAQVDLSSATDAASVAAAFEVAFDGITGFSAVCATDDSAADGTMLFTQVGRGPVADAQSLLEDDAGAGGVSVAETNAGVASTVDISADTITIASHGLATGVKIQLTTTGTLPAGLALITDYFVIVVDANTIQLASSLANAQAGTEIDITDQGADGSTNTLTGVALAGASATLYASLDGSVYAVVPSSAQNITASCQLIWNEVDPMYKYLKLVIVLTAGQLSGGAQLLINGDGE